MKKTVLWLITLIFLSIAGSWGYIVATTLADFEFLLLCSQGKEEWIPKPLCQAYLFNFGGKPSEIAALNQGVGIRWATDAENEDDRRKLVDFLLKKGVDINAIDQHSGLTALHAAVLENDLPTAELLLNHNANPSVKDRDHGKTPLEFALERKGKPNQPDRTAIIKLLEHATERSGTVTK